MKLSKRESNLIRYMVIILLAVLYMNYLLLPGLSYYDMVKIELEKVEKEYQDALNAVEEEIILDKEIEELSDINNEVIKKYFTTTQQEELVLLLLEFINDVKVDSIIYSKYTTIAVADRKLFGQTVEVDFESSYAEVMELLKNNWDFHKQIAVDELSFSKVNDSTLTGNITLHYYWAPETTYYEDQLFHWVQNEAYYKGNPFASVEHIDRQNYIYIGGDSSKLEELFNKPFADVGGHWAESEIESFRQSGYVIADDQNRFLPDAPITRGEYIIMLDKIYQWPAPSDDIDLTGFQDFSELGNYQGAIAKAILKGYMGGYVIGYTDNTLRPRDPITYEEIEYIMSKVKEDETFIWDSVGQRIESERGYSSPGLIDKTQSVSRAEAVYLMYFYK